MLPTEVVILKSGLKFLVLGIELQYGRRVTAENVAFHMVESAAFPRRARSSVG